MQSLTVCAHTSLPWFPATPAPFACYLRSLPFKAVVTVRKFLNNLRKILTLKQHEDCIA